MLQINTLIERWQTGDERAAEAIYNQTWRSTFGLAYSLLDDAADAEEVRQIVLLRMIQRPQILPEAKKLASWIRRCVVNESITLIRQKKRRNTVELSQQEDSVVEPGGSDLAEELRCLLDSRLRIC